MKVVSSSGTVPKRHRQAVGSDLGEVAVIPVAQRLMVIDIDGRACSGALNQDGSANLLMVSSPLWPAFAVPVACGR